MMQQLVPQEVLDEYRNAITDVGYFDSRADWYPAGPPDIHSDRTYPTTPTVLPARFQETSREFYTQQGQQAQVLVRTVDVPWDVGQKVGLRDKLVPHGTPNVTRTWPTILQITPMPDIAIPVMVRIRQGAA